MYGNESRGITRVNAGEVYLYHSKENYKESDSIINRTCIYRVIILNDTSNSIWTLVRVIGTPPEGYFQRYRIGEVAMVYNCALKEVPPGVGYLNKVSLPDI